MDKLLNAILIKRLNEQDKKITDSFNNIKEVVETIVNKHYDSLNVDFSIEKILEEINTRYNTTIDRLSQDIGEEFRDAIQELKDSNQDALDKSIKDYITKAEKKIAKLKPKDGKDGKDGKDYILTEKDKNDIASSVDIKEKKIEEIRDGIEKLVGEEKLDVLELKNLDKIEVDYSQIKNLPQQQIIYTGGGISQETLDNALSTKADLENGKVPLEQLPDDIGGVQSVNGQTGVVILKAENIPTNSGSGSGTVEGDLQSLDVRVTTLENNPSTPFYEADNSEITSTYAYWGFNNASPQYQINRRNVSTFEKTTAIGAWADRLTLTYT